MQGKWQPIIVWIAQLILNSCELDATSLIILLVLLHFALINMPKYHDVWVSHINKLPFTLSFVLGEKQYVK